MVKSIIKNCIIHLIICTLAITTIMKFIPAVNKKVTAQAAGTNTDAEHVDFEYVPGALEWAGSQSRTGIAVYIVNTGTGMRVKEPKVLLWGDDEDWLDEINAGSGGGIVMSSELRRGSVASLADYKFVNKTQLRNMPCPVSGDGNIWSSRSNYMKNWMDGASKADKKLTNAAYIAKKLFDDETFKNLKVGSGDNGDSKWKMVFETVSAHALYKIHNGKDVIKSYDDGGDGKKHPVKMLRTAYAWCKTYDYNGIDITKEQRYGERGTANSKWMQAVLKSYGVLNDYAISINKITPTDSVPASQGIREGWATGVANQLEIPIETSTTGGSPSEIETPNESLGTDGDCIIHKTYITKKKYADGHVEYQPADECKEKYQTSNYVHVVAEEGKYSLASWKSSNQNQSTPRTIEEYKSIPAGHLSGSNDAYIHLMTNRKSKNGEVIVNIEPQYTNEKNLYVLLIKTEKEDMNDPPFDGDYLLGESEITKQVLLSDARGEKNGALSNIKDIEFRWSSPGFTPSWCKGHHYFHADDSCVGGGSASETLSTDNISAVALGTSPSNSRLALSLKSSSKSSSSGKSVPSFGSSFSRIFLSKK